MIRLNKFLSLSGVSSRRGAEALVAEGRVKINGQPAEAHGQIIDEAADKVIVDGVEVHPVDQKIYVLLNKPKSVMTTVRDPFRRKTVMHYLRKLTTRVYPVGRLDFDTEGVLLMTNDGDLAYRLTHPKYEVTKTYEAVVKGLFTPEAGEKIKAGIQLEDGAIGHAGVDILGFIKGNTRIRMTLHEGRKREVKQLCAKVGHEVVALRRIDFAGLTSRGLNLGEWRYLTDKELRSLKDMVGLNGEKENPA